MNNIESDKLTPEEVLMNCLSEAERISEIIIIVHTKDDWYETWSNNLPIHERIGLIREAAIRTERQHLDAEEIKE